VLNGSGSTTGTKRFAAPMGLVNSNAAALNGANNTTGQSDNSGGGQTPVTATNAAALNGPGASTGDGGSTNSSTITNAAIANGAGTTTGTGGDTSGAPAPASGSVDALDPGTGGGTGGGSGLPVTADLTVDTNGNPSGPLVTADASHTDGVPGQSDANVDINLTPAATTAGDTVSTVGDTLNGTTSTVGDTLNSTTSTVGDTVSSVTNNAGDTINNVTNTTTGTGSGTGAGSESRASAEASGSGGGGGSVAIGGFSGGYNGEDWHARCARVLRDPKHYAKKVWRHCRELVRMEQREDGNKKAREAARH